MIISTSSFSTEHAFDHFKELCTHLAKRVSVDAGCAKAHIALPIGTCDLVTSGTDISALIVASSDHIDRMEEVFGGWIERIAFRENATLKWQRATLQTQD